MDITWYGTATVIISEGEHSLLVDPFISMNPEAGTFSPEKAVACSNIFITHGHFDHLVNVPSLVEKYGQTVHCSETAADNLIKKGTDSNNINTVRPGDILEIGPFTVTVLLGKHIKFDFKLIRKTLFNSRVIKYRKNLKKILAANSEFPEGEVLVFQIEAGGKKVLVLGSMNLAKKVAYPKGADLLMLPFQGRSDINRYALRFVKKLKPGAIYLHHFDDTFPPVSSSVNFKLFQKIMKKKYRKIKVVIPEYDKTINI